MFKEIVRNAALENDRKGLLLLCRDLEAWSKGLSKPQKAELAKILESELSSFQYVESITHALIDSIYSKGKVESDDEYESVHSFLSDLALGDHFYNRRGDLEFMMEQYKSSKQK